MNDLLSPLTIDLVDLFEGPLRGVRFPDADAERLGAAVAQVTAAYASLAEAEAALEGARGVLEEKQRAAAQETERALAYARIYAADRPELRAALDALVARSPARRGAGRPRKEATRASLTEERDSAASRDGMPRDEPGVVGETIVGETALRQVRAKRKARSAVDVSASSDTDGSDTHEIARTAAE